MEAVYWLIAIILLLVIEAMTMGLTTIWFAGGAVIAFIACLAGADPGGIAGASGIYQTLCEAVYQPRDYKDQCKRNHRKRGAGDEEDRQP